MNKILFKETQRNKCWILVFLCLPLLLFIYGIYYQVLLGMPFGNKPASNQSLLVITIIYIFFILFVFNMKLVTEIYPHGIKISYRPFLTDKFYGFEELESAVVNKYSPILLYLGHGYRKGFDGSTAYTMSGNYAILLTFHDGSKLRIGTNQPNSIESVLATVNI